MLLDVEPQPFRLFFAEFGKGCVSSIAGNLTESHKHFMEEKALLEAAGATVRRLEPPANLAADALHSAIEDYKKKLAEKK